MPLFDSFETTIEKSETSIDLTQPTFDQYTFQDYINEINKRGLEPVWPAILEYCINGGSNSLLQVDNFAMLYEAGLAELDKENKKSSGQYFTPNDVASLMARWLKELDGENVCDVGCGTGNLILAYLREVDSSKVIALLKNKRIYLYDNDETALKIARYSIAIKYGKQYLDSINIICGDFLDSSISLPNNSKVISNPPYFKITSICPNWALTENLMSSKDFYSAIMEKCIISNSKLVIITPYSFIGGNKFFALRQVMNNHSGFIVSFDNVPGNIFNGKKHGIFNSNTANSVRAAITVVDNKSNKKGFRTSHLIRFRTAERKKLLSNGYLEDLASTEYYLVDTNSPAYPKCHKELQGVFNTWRNKSSQTLKELLAPYPNEHALYIPNTCRYFTTASSVKLNRVGMIKIHAQDLASYDFLYCLINSSFAYWHWRIYDGGITYTCGLLESMPVFIGLLSREDKNFFRQMREQMSQVENKYIIKKLNAGKVQENIKFPSTYRKKINERLFNILGCADSHKLLDLVHSNAVFVNHEED